MIQPWILWTLAAIAFVVLSLLTATLVLLLDLRRKIGRLLKLPQAQPSKVAGEGPKARRERFMQAMRESAT